MFFKLKEYIFSLGKDTVQTPKESCFSHCKLCMGCMWLCYRSLMISTGVSMLQLSQNTGLGSKTSISIQKQPLFGHFNLCLRPKIIVKCPSYSALKYQGSRRPISYTSASLWNVLTHGFDCKNSKSKINIKNKTCFLN